MSETSSEAPAVPHGAATPVSLLEQMQELLASLNKDLAGLDADLQSSGTRAADEHGTADRATDASARAW